MNCTVEQSNSDGFRGRFSPWAASHRPSWRPGCWRRPRTSTVRTDERRGGATTSNIGETTSHKDSDHKRLAGDKHNSSNSSSSKHGHTSNNVITTITTATIHAFMHAQTNSGDVTPCGWGGGGVRGGTAALEQGRRQQTHPSRQPTKRDFLLHLV